MNQRVLQYGLYDFRRYLLPTLRHLPQRHERRVSISIFGPDPPHLLVILSGNVRVIGSTGRNGLFIAHQLRPRTRPISSNAPVSNRFFGVRHTQITFRHGFYVIHGTGVHPSHVRRPFRVRSTRGKQHATTPRGHDSSTLLVGLALLRSL